MAEKTETYQKLVKDLKIAMEINEKSKKIETISIKPPIEDLINYALERNIIETTKDVIALTKEFPELEDDIISIYDNHIANEKKRLKEIIKTNCRC